MSVVVSINRHRNLSVLFCILIGVEFWWSVRFYRTICQTGTGRSSLIRHRLITGERIVDLVSFTPVSRVGRKHIDYFQECMRKISTVQLQLFKHLSKLNNKFLKLFSLYFINLIKINSEIFQLK